MALVRWSDQPLVSLREAMDRFFEQAFGPSLWSWRADTAAPIVRVPLDVYEAGDAYHVMMLVPGIKPDEVQITYQNGTLAITGELKPPAGEFQAALVREIGYGRFYRELRLPTEIVADQVQATCENGVLHLTLPKAEHARTKTIKVSAK
jgi:HSP20 family protein